MAGCRSLQDSEVTAVLSVLTSNRDKALFTLGLKTGFRISELLSLRLNDLYQNGQVLARVKVQKRHSKGKVSSREVILHPVAIAALESYIAEISNMPADCPLFFSRNGATNFKKSIGRVQAHQILKDAYTKAGLTGPVATHSMRKSFARKVYNVLKFDLVATQKALGHKSVSSTAAYLSPEQSTIDSAILSA